MGYTQEQECQFPNQVRTEERKPVHLPQARILEFFQSEWEKFVQTKQF